MTNEPEQFGVYQRSFYGVPVTVTYRYVEPEEGGPAAELQSVHLPGYPDIDVSEGISDEWISTFEADAIYHEHNYQGKAGTSRKGFEPFEKLAAILGLSYREAKDKEAVTMIHVFGIRYAEDIRRCGSSVAKLVRHSSIPDSYVAEVHKGMRLSKFVKLV